MRQSHPGGQGRQISYLQQSSDNNNNNDNNNYNDNNNNNNNRYIHQSHIQRQQPPTNSNYQYIQPPITDNNNHNDHQRQQEIQQQIQYHRNQSILYETMLHGNNNMNHHQTSTPNLQPTTSANPHQLNQYNQITGISTSIQTVRHNPLLRLQQFNQPICIQQSAAKRKRNDARSRRLYQYLWERAKAEFPSNDAWFIESPNDICPRRNDQYTPCEYEGDNFRKHVWCKYGHKMMKISIQTPCHWHQHAVRHHNKKNNKWYSTKVNEFNVQEQRISNLTKALPNIEVKPDLPPPPMSNRRVVINIDDDENKRQQRSIHNTSNNTHTVPNNHTAGTQNLDNIVIQSRARSISTLTPQPMYTNNNNNNNKSSFVKVY